MGRRKKDDNQKKKKKKKKKTNKKKKKKQLDVKTSYLSIERLQQKSFFTIYKLKNGVRHKKPHHEYFIQAPSKREGRGYK